MGIFLGGQNISFDLVLIILRVYFLVLNIL